METPKEFVNEFNKKAKSIYNLDGITLMYSCTMDYEGISIIRNESAERIMIWTNHKPFDPRDVLKEVMKFNEELMRLVTTFHSLGISLSD